jgi:hypothetical protein
MKHIDTTVLAALISTFILGSVVTMLVDAGMTPTVEETAAWAAKKEDDRAAERADFLEELEMFKVAAMAAGCFKQ